MAQILIVEDQRGMRDALRAMLQECGHVVSEAENGRVATALFSSTPFDLVIADFQMPQMDGLELLKWIKSKSQTPVIMLTAFSHILETQMAFNLGASDFLTKPVTKDEISKSVSKVLGLAPPSSESVDEEMLYCQIPIEDFIYSGGVQINVYVRLSDNKYIRVAHKGDQLPTERVENYRAKGLHYVYARKEEFAKLVGFSLNHSKILQSNAIVPREKKLRFAQYSSELILEHARVNGIDRKALRQGIDCLNLCLSLLIDSKNIFELLEAVSGYGDWLYRHSLSVGVYSVMIGRKMGWAAQGTLFKLGVGGLFHDVGEKEIELSILNKPASALNEDEVSLLETHPTRGRDILQDLNEFPDDIVQIVFEHQETSSGQGYPRELTKEKIHPLAKVVSVADKFCTIAIPSLHSEGYSAHVAVEKMEAVYRNELDRGALAALKSLCTLEKVAEQ